MIAAISAALLCAASANEDLSLKNGRYYSSNGTEIPGVVSRGIDISTFQKDIDWEALRAEYDAGNLDFVIIRCGYGDDEESQDDYRYYQNVEACAGAGIPFGIYLYSYADTAEHAESELKHVLRLIEGCNVTYPIFYDIENDLHAKIGADGIRMIVDIFCGGLYELGYETGVYSMRSWYTNDNRVGALDFEGMPWLVKWIAEYNNTLKYDGGFDIWQATSKGRVNGISTDVDVDYSFLPKRTAEHCYVTFDINTGGDAECDLSPMHLNRGEKLGCLPRPVCGTAKVLGWYTSPKGGRKVSEDTVISEAGQLRLYARWGSGQTPAEEPSGEAPAPPDKSGFTVIRPMVANAPFSVNGMTNLMEYRVDGGAWTSGERIRAVADGQLVEVRYRAAAGRPAGEPLGIFIHTSSTLKKVAIKRPTCVSEGIQAHWKDGSGRVFRAIDDYFGSPDTTSLTIAPTGVHTYEFSCSEVCTVCGQTRVTEHSFPSEWRRVGGYHCHVCSVCGKESEHLPHSETVTVRTEPGCLTRGYERRYCADCGMIISSVPVAPLGHLFDEGICLRCGTQDPDFRVVTDAEETPPPDSVTDAPPDTVPETVKDTDDPIPEAVGKAGKGVVAAASVIAALCAAAAVAAALREKNRKNRKKNKEKGGEPE